VPTSPARRLVRKADAPPLVAAYDASGRLIGVVDPADITPVAVDTTAPRDDAGAEADDPSAEDVTKAMQQLKKALRDTVDAPEQARLATSMNQAAAVGLRRIHSVPPRL
jgi:hypothetical protein